MRMVSDESGALILRGDILEGANQAFLDGRYVEAFDLLQGLIDWRLINIFLKNETSDKPIEPYFAEYRTNKLAFELSSRKLITDAERPQVLEFYELRKKIVHKVILYTYLHHHYQKYQVTRVEAINGFDKGKKLANLLREKRVNMQMDEGEEWDHQASPKGEFSEAPMQTGYLDDGTVMRYDAKRKKWLPVGVKLTDEHMATVSIPPIFVNRIAELVTTTISFSDSDELNAQDTAEFRPAVGFGSSRQSSPIGQGRKGVIVQSTKYHKFKFVNQGDGDALIRIKYQGDDVSFNVDDQATRSLGELISPGQERNFETSTKCNVLVLQGIRAEGAPGTRLEIQYIGYPAWIIENIDQRERN